jgi:VWFA-related protein
MRRLTLGLLALLPAALALGVPAGAQTDGKSPYTIEFDQNGVQMLDHGPDGQDGVYVRVKFNISLDGNRVLTAVDDYKLVIEEDGKKVRVVDLPRPTVSSELSTILALDTSGSMKEHNRMPMAREAAKTFLTKLPAPAYCGLVLFDHEIRKTIDPTPNREPILAAVLAVAPRGGTAFRDAAFEAIGRLAKAPQGHDRALVLMTDGADVNSTRSMDEVIGEAKKHKVRVYTIGIGTPGTFEQVSTALVLDRSGSMELPADDQDVGTPKIKALHTAAAAFVNMMSESGRVSLIAFGSQVEPPRAFSNNKAALKVHVNALAPAGETALFDAVYTGVATLEADGAKGKRAVVAMTDGIDNSSRRRVDEVIARAREANIKLYLLGFGRQNEIDHATMKKMADETGGKYYHAGNKDALVEIFEALSIELHDEGIDEASLTRLAKETGGAYYPAKDVSKLKFILEQVSQTIQRETREVVFPSINQRKDGLQRNVALRLVRAGTDDSVDPGILIDTRGYQTHGLIVAEMHPFVYLVLLGVLGGLIALPAVFRRPANGV